MKYLALTLTGALLLTGCDETSTQSPTAAAPQPTAAASQEKLFDCAERAGISGRFATTTTVSGGTVTNVIKPGEDVTPQQAAAANECINAA